MRVTNQMIGNNIKQYIQENLAKVSRTQQQLSTGRTILKPSDNPTDISILMSTKAQKKINEQYKQNIDDGLSYLNATENALGSVGDVLSQANELAVQGSNDTMTAEDREAIAEQVDKLIDETVELANTSTAGKYIFAGKDNAQRPFQRVDKDTIMYSGDLEEIYREIANKGEYEVTTPGVLPDGSDPPGVFGNVDKAEVDDPNIDETEVNGGVFGVLFELRDQLENNDSDAIGNLISDIQDETDNVLQRRAAVGARIRHFESVKEQIDEQEIRMETTMENINSADIGRLSIDYTEQQLTYQSSLAAGSRTLQTSLLDFLR